jgi:hypothetical protein
MNSPFALRWKTVSSSSIAEALTMLHSSQQTNCEVSSANGPALFACEDR